MYVYNVYVNKEVYGKFMEKKNNKDFYYGKIEELFNALYINQKPRYYTNLIKSKFGGQNPIDDIIIYETDDYYHILTMGFSKKFDFELTYKVKKNIDFDYEVKNIFDILMHLAVYSFESNVGFKQKEYIYTDQTDGIDVEAKSKLVGFVTILDKMANEVKIENRTINFIELVGVTYEEMNTLVNKILPREKYIDEIIEKYGDVTDYMRQN